MLYRQIYNIVLLTTIVMPALHADPIFYLKNDSDRTVLLGITENNGQTEFIEALAPKKEYTMDRSHDSQQIVALSIIYCPDKKGTGCNALDANGNVSTETENILATQGETANFKFENTAEVRRWYLKLKIEKDNSVFIAPQEGRFGKTSNLKYSLSGNIKKNQIKSARNAPVAKPQASKAPTVNLTTPPPPPADLPPALPASISSATKSSAARPGAPAQTPQNPLIKKYLDKRYSFDAIEKHYLKLQSKGYTGLFIDPQDYKKEHSSVLKDLTALLTEASQKIKQSNDLEATLYTIAFPAYYKAKMISDVLESSSASTAIINDAKQALTAFLEERIDNKKGQQPMLVQYLDNLETGGM